MTTDKDCDSKKKYEADMNEKNCADEIVNSYVAI